MGCVVVGWCEGVWFWSGIDFYDGFFVWFDLDNGWVGLNFSIVSLKCFE